MRQDIVGLASYLRSHKHPGAIMVCEEPKIIYMKPAKTAGTSIFHGVLEKKVPGIFHLRKRPVQYQKWLAQLTDEKLEEYYIFSVVRNPWDRLVSAAAFLKIPFNHFVRNIFDYWKNNRIRIHSLPLSLYTHIGEKQFVDKICRFECLQPDMNIVFDHYGIDRQRLPHARKSEHEHYSYCYSQHEIEKIRKIYEEDIINFGYTFEADRRGGEKHEQNQAR